ncbi:uncharacterized protein VTP21DRAFT_1802 [Calcarisporiella thermophila]|uniref:uncharacterized protein n=1 Tax=Calcarisporiella thermophila TaxID=911321 RepID=UPI003742C404
MRYPKFFFLFLAVLCLLSVARADNASTANEEEVILPSLTPEQQEKLKTTEETFQFQAEVSRLMHLIINSLYKTREIFLRELISNASDALDKIRFLALTDKDALSTNPTLNITIAADKKRRTLTITDSGIGMTKQQLRDNLGTIAKSGTSEFIAALEENKNKGVADSSNLIGQFGVGFYSAFLVADRIVVASKHNNDPVQHIWESRAVNDFKIAEDPRGNTLGRGTQITLHFKEDAVEFLGEEVLQGLVGKYSEFINFPIYLQVTRKEVVKKDEAAKEEKESAEESEDEVKVEDAKKEKGPEETVEVKQWELMNTQKPIWMRDSKEVTKEEYHEFYKTLTKDFNDPITYSHLKGEGEVDFRALLYIPSKAPSQFYSQQSGETRNVKLFVKRVFITDEFGEEGFLPRYLKFIRALVDADDLQLNVSRETLQQHKALRFIKRYLTKKALDLVAALGRTEDYPAFLKEFGTSLKLGIIEDNENRAKLAKLLRFPTSKFSDGNLTSLEDYVSRMREGQNMIYYLGGGSLDEVRQSPFLERLLQRGYEVLFMVEPIDEILLSYMPAYDGKMFHNLAKGELKLKEDEAEDSKKKEEELKTRFKPLVEWLQTVLSDYVEKVTISNRLTTSPCAIVAADFGWSGNLERIMAAQALQQKDEMAHQVVMGMKKRLEINPYHPVISELLRSVEDGEATQETRELAVVLYETTAIRSGYMIKDPLRFASRVEALIRSNLGVGLEAKAEVPSSPAPSESETGKDTAAKKVAEEKGKPEEAKDDDWDAWEKQLTEDEKGNEKGNEKEKKPEHDEL